MDIIRLGILGPGRIVKRVMTDIPRCEYITLTAIASRDIQRARAVALEYGAPLYFGTYKELAECPDVDLVYIATPNSCHLAHAKLMMSHGKHVICEKPLAMNGDEAREMVKCAKENHVFLMEAMWTRFMPAFRKMYSLISEGAIGELTHIFSCFSCTCPYDPESRLFKPELGGGVLLDLGVYSLMAATMFLGYEPLAVQSSCKLVPGGVDIHTTVNLIFKEGRTAQLFCASDSESRSDLILFGSKGTIHAQNFWHCERFSLELPGKEPLDYSFPSEHEGHRHEFDHAAKCILDGLTESPLMPLDESIAVADIMTQIRHENGEFFPGEK